MANTTSFTNATPIIDVAAGDKIDHATFTAMLDVLSALADHKHLYTDTWSDNCNCNCDCGRGSI